MILLKKIENVNAYINKHCTSLEKSDEGRKMTIEMDMEKISAIQKLPSHGKQIIWKKPGEL